MIICICVFAGSVFYSDFKSDADVVKLSYRSAILVAFCIGVFIVFYIFMTKLLLPGDLTIDTTPASDAAPRLSASHAGVIGFISFALYKLCGRKEEATRQD